MRVLLAVMIALAGCATHSPRKSVREISPSEIWLVEMLTQRMEVSSAVLMADPMSSAPESQVGELAASVELAMRAGLPEHVARNVFSAQLAATSQRDAKHTAAPGSVPPSTINALILQRNAIDAQIVAVLLRLPNLPGDKAFRTYSKKIMLGRGIHPRTADIALEPFRSSPAR